MFPRVITIAVILILLSVSRGSPATAASQEPAKNDSATAEQAGKDEKEQGENGSLRDGINRAYDGFKKETTKGKKNLKDLYEREKEKSGKE